MTLLSTIIRPAMLGAGLLFAFSHPLLADEPAPAPANPQPAADSLTPGLQVDYFYDYYNWVDEVVEAVSSDNAEHGQTLPMLDYQTGEGKVLSSNKENGVGAHIQGMLHFDEAGEYSMVAQSNDGIRVVLGGVRIIEDPDVHFDQYSKFVTVKVTEPAWYPLDIHYFEKKGTSTLKLLWRKPSMASDAEMTVVPASAFAHSAKSG